MLAKLQPFQKVLLDAAEVIKECGWYAGLHRPYTGHAPQCAYTAIWKAAGRDDGCEVQQAAERRLYESLGLTGRASFAIPAWNDAQPSAAEVIKALQEAAL